MKKLAYFAIAFYIMLILFGVAVFAPTLGRQVPFNSWCWNHAHYPFGRVRYYMSESLMERLESTRPTYSEAYELLGKDRWDIFNDGYWKKQTENHELEYLLMSRLTLGWDEYYLNIIFDEQGNYEKVYISHLD